MKQSECEVLAGRFSELQQQGLVDVKFLLRNQDEATIEDVCAEVSAMLVALESASRPLDFKDTRGLRGN